MTNDNSDNNNNNENNNNDNNDTSSLTGNIHTPNQWIVTKKDNVPDELLWTVDITGESVTYYKPEKIEYSRWLFIFADKNKLHQASSIKDHTLEFSTSNKIQSKMILNLLIDGTIQTVENGFVFFMEIHKVNRNGKRDGSHFHALFVNNHDYRLHAIKIFHLMRSNYKYQAKADLSFEECLKLLDMELMPDYYA